MNRLIKVSTLLMALFIIGCEDNDAENNNMIIYEVTTEDVSSGPYYFNFASGKKDNSTWHLSYTNVDAGQGFSMPSISLHSSVMLTVDNTSKFEDIEKSPSPSAFAPEAGRLGYGGANAALNYNMATHKVSTSNDNYIIYDTASHKVFKVHFDEYSSGVVLFRYAELSGK